MPDPTDLRYISDAPDYRHLEDRARYKALYDEVGTLPVNRVVRWRPEWMRHFAPAPRSRILELGAHNGPNLIHYARLGHEVDGVEISDTLIETFETVAAREAPEVRARMRMFRAWIEAFRPHGAYDYVLLTEVLEHVADPVAVLGAARRAMGGHSLLYVTSPATHWGNNTHVRAVPPEELSRWLVRADLVPVTLDVFDDRTVCTARTARAATAPGAAPKVALVSGDPPESPRFRTRLGTAFRALASRGATHVDVAATRRNGRPFVAERALATADLWVIGRFGLDAGTIDPFRRLVQRLDKPFLFDVDDLPLDAGGVSFEAVRWLLTHAALAVARTSAVAPWALHHGAKQVVVIGDAIDPEVEGPRGVLAGETGPLLVGLVLHEESDAAAVAPLVRRVSERPDCRIVPFTPSESDGGSIRRLLDANPALDLALVPLADTPRNRCRSPLVWMELAAAGVPGVFGPGGPYAGVVRTGEDGVHPPAAPAAWEFAVSRLLDSPEERRRMGEAARRRVRRERPAETSADLWRHAIDVVLGAPS